MQRPVYSCTDSLFRMLGRWRPAAIAASSARSGGARQPPSPAPSSAASGKPAAIAAPCPATRVGPPPYQHPHSTIRSCALCYSSPRAMIIAHYSYCLLRRNDSTVRAGSMFLCYCQWHRCPSEWAKLPRLPTSPACSQSTAHPKSRGSNALYSSQRKMA